MLVRSISHLYRRGSTADRISSFSQVFGLQDSDTIKELTISLERRDMHIPVRALSFLLLGVY